MELEVYHGTAEKESQDILKKGFKIIDKEVTNDLGNGIYTFCPDEQHLWNPKNNAKKYADRYKKGKTVVLKVTINTSSNVYYIDLDDENFKQQWEKLREALEERANEIWRKFSNGSAKRRHNIDGIILEQAIKRGMFDRIPDFMVKCTYTSFVSKSISNFPNGRELVIRNVNIINKIERAEV